jgi:signal transduction histidine kinase
MPTPDDKCCYPLRRNRWCFVVTYRRSQSLFFKVVVLCILLVVIAGVVHVFLDRDDVGNGHGHVIFTLVLVAVIIIAVLRRLFAPMRKVLQGIQALAEGNLDFRFEETGHGEFSRVAEAFNVMSGQIQEMLDSKTQLLLDVSHELRSPLTRIKVALEMSPDTPQKTFIMQDIAEMETMLAELLESESLKSGNGSLVIEELDLISVVNEVVDKYAERQPGVVLRDVPETLQLYADDRRLRRVMHNVLENAMKYSQHSPRPVEVNLSVENSFAVITIRDFGEGIEEEEQVRIFEPFYRIDKSRNRKSGGYGLGLSLCSEIMRAHKGDIILKSQPGDGTEIKLLFPLKPDNSSA